MNAPKDLSLPIRAATETARAHGIAPDRCEILQDGNTLVLRLSETLVARVVTDLDGPRQGAEWFEREIAVARFLAENGAPVIPVHPGIPPGPHEHLGYRMNFWQYVDPISGEPDPATVGETLYHCHRILTRFPGTLPKLAILTESLDLLDTLGEKRLFPESTLTLLRDRLTSSTEALRGRPFQPLHGDAHPGNLMLTARGTLWTDWEDTFSGPVEWDLASIIWNARILENDHRTADAILTAYLDSGGRIDPHALHHCLIARAAVMSAWYPILYPDSSPERKSKLHARIDWLAGDTKVEFSERLLVCSSEVPLGIWDTGDFLEAQREARARELGGF
jgi:hypothetical protein